MTHLLFNPKTKKYSLTEGVRPLPPKFSLDDKYASYRREEKKKELKKLNLY